MRLPRHPPAILLLFIALVLDASGADDTEWRGFRGIERHAANPAAAPVLEWSPLRNVAWSVEVPGRGHSSPVVSGERVLLTSAYLADRSARLRGALSLFSLALAGALACLVPLLLARDLSGRKRRGPISTLPPIALALLSLLLPLLALFGDRAFHYEKSPDLGWLGTAVALVMGLGLAGARAPARSRWELLLILTLPLASPLIFFGLPGLSSALGKGLLSKTALALGVMTAAPLLLAAALLLRRRLSGAQPAAASAPARIFSIAAIALGLLAFVSQNSIASGAQLTRAILCFNLADGDLAWRAEGLDGPEGILHGENTPASPTPVVDDGRVFAFFGSGGVICCDLEGRFLWTNPGIRFEGIHGTGASPVALAGRVVLLVGSPAAPYLCALDADTGAIAWKVALEATGTSGSNRTPVLLESPSGHTIVIWHNQTLSGHELASGELLWTHGVGLTPGEQVASISSDGVRLYCVGPTEAVAFAIHDLARPGLEPLWSQRVRGPDVPTPIAIDGLLFIVSDSGIATCLDAATGATRWRERLDGNFFSSPVAAGSRVYFSSREGRTTVVAADAEFRVMARNELEEPIYASMVPLADRLVLRTAGRLYCIAERDDN